MTITSIATHAKTISLCAFRTFSVRSFAFLALFLVAAVFSRADEKSAQSPYYEDTVANSNPLRAAQAKELDEYILSLKKDHSRLQALFTPDYTSPCTFERSASAYRLAFSQSIGYPPPGE